MNKKIKGKEKKNHSDETRCTHRVAFRELYSSITSHSAAGATFHPYFRRHFGTNLSNFLLPLLLLPPLRSFPNWASSIYSSSTYSLPLSPISSLVDLIFQVPSQDRHFSSLLVSYSWDNHLRERQGRAPLQHQGFTSYSKQLFIKNKSLSQKINERVWI